MIAMQDNKQWYRFASFASGKCLGATDKGGIEWQDCSQYEVWQRWQQFTLRTRTKKGKSRYSMESRMREGYCIAHDVRMPHGKEKLATRGSMILAPCEERLSTTWHQVPDTTGLPGALAIGKYHKLCVSKHSGPGNRRPRLGPCVKKLG